MADFTKQGPFADDAFPAATAAVLNAWETGIKDAAEHHRRGTYAARPAASALNKNHVYWAYDTGERFLSDGATWLPLPVGNAGLQDGAVTLAKLGAGVTALLASTGEKAALAGRGGVQTTGFPARTTPSDVNRYLLESNLGVRFLDLPGAGNTSFRENGLWVVTSVYGYSHDAPHTRCSLVMITTDTGAGTLWSVQVLATAGYATNVTTSHVAENSGGTTGTLRVTTTHGNTRTFFQALRGGNTGTG